MIKANQLFRKQGSTLATNCKDAFIYRLFDIIQPTLNNLNNYGIMLHILGDRSFYVSMGMLTSHDGMKYNANFFYFFSFFCKGSKRGMTHISSETIGKCNKY